MIDSTWITVSAGDALMVALSALGIYLTLIVLTRLAGLRSFSKMSSFDFATTVAIGSVLASVFIAKDPPLMQGIVAMAVLYGIQQAVAVLRRFNLVCRLVDNEPLLLMAGDEILHDHLREAQITPHDLQSKLREANVFHPSQIRAVVAESTGNISVLHGGSEAPQLDLDLLSNVRGIEHLRRKLES